MIDRSERVLRIPFLAVLLCGLVATGVVAGSPEAVPPGGTETEVHAKTGTGGRGMGERSGIFWEGVAGRVPMPRAAATLGFEFIDADVEKGTIEVAFKATEAFTTPLGEVLGGFLAAMLYDTVGPAVLATLGPDQFISTIELKASFLRPAAPGRIVGRGHIVHRDGDVAFVEASLTSAAGALVATATATIRVIPMPPRKP
jgi:uncharacterized protein (TIGR00369 family)